MVSELLEVSLLSMSVPATYQDLFGLTAPPSKADNIVSIYIQYPLQVSVGKTEVSLIVQIKIAGGNLVEE